MSDDRLYRLLDIKDALIREREAKLLALEVEASLYCDDLVARIRELESEIREIANGFLPDGTYAGRPIYVIAPQCFPAETGKES